MCMFQSRYRAASHFRIVRIECTWSGMTSFQSRYRAASHFRMPNWRRLRCLLAVSISLSSGFSFQERLARTLTGVRYSFNLVIERLLISGCEARVECLMTKMFQSRYRAASHFRVLRRGDIAASIKVSISLSSGFSFQVEIPYPDPPRLFFWFQSRYRAASHFR